MRSLITAATEAVVHDFDGETLNDPVLLKKLHGLGCVTDTVLNYVELDFAEEADLRGGYLRLVHDGKKKLRLEIEIDASRKLKPRELKQLREDLIGQVSDGIGSGAFDELHQATGLTIQFPHCDRLRAPQTAGKKAWTPRATAAASQSKKYEQIKRWVDKQDGQAASPKPGTQAKKKVATKQADKASSKQAATKKAPAKQAAAAKASGKPSQQNFKKLLRLLDKPERDSLAAEIKTELKAVGDLSGLPDGELPYGNFREPRILKLLLNAGLSPETLDRDGHPLLWQAAAGVQSVRLMLTKDVDVNRRAKNASQETALMRAASLGRLSCVTELLAAGADPALKDGQGQTAVEHAESSREPDTAKIVAALKAARK